MRDKGKGRPDLIPAIALLRMAKRFEVGADAGYELRGWIDPATATYSLHYGKALRHLGQWQLGMRDEDHLGAAAAQIAILMDLEERVMLRNLPVSVDDMAQQRLVPVAEDEDCGCKDIHGQCACLPGDPPCPLPPYDETKSCRERGDHVQNCHTCPDTSCCDNDNRAVKP